jgi:hypothetical protein
MHIESNLCLIDSRKILNYCEPNWKTFWNEICHVHCNVFDTDQMDLDKQMDLRFAVWSGCKTNTLWRQSGKILRQLLRLFTQK